MRHRSRHGGRHELGQNFLIHRPTIERMVALVAATDGPILELGAGDGALTEPLARLGRPLTAIDIDERRVRALRRRVPRATIVVGDALAHPLDRPVLVGNVPFHLTTPILRRLLATDRWQHAILLTQWEVARKRAGVGGGTLLTAQTAPWFSFELAGRVPAHRFRPVPSVDGGLLVIARRAGPLVDAADRRRYQAFVRAVFTGPGRGMAARVRRQTGWSAAATLRALARARIDPAALPRDLDAQRWAALWHAVRARPRRPRHAADRPRTPVAAPDGGRARATPSDVDHGRATASDRPGGR